MDSLGAEECHSSESGWTKYLGSHINDSGCSEDGHSYNTDYGGAQSHPQNGDSDDDSMASDASSGPSHRGKKIYDDGDKKGNKTQENKLRIMEGKKKVEKKGVVIVDTKGKTPVQDGGKVRNFFCRGKKK